MLPDNIHEMISDVRIQYILDRYLKIVKLPKYRDASVSKEQDIKDFKKILNLGYFTEGDLAKYYKIVKGKIPPPLRKDFEQLVYDVSQSQSKKQKKISPEASSRKISPRKINFDNTKEFNAYFDALETKENKKRKNLSNDLLNQGFANPLNISEKRYFDVIKKDIQKQIKNMNKEHLKKYKSDEFVKSIYRKEQDAKNYNNDSYKNQKYFKRGIPQGLTNQEKLSGQMSKLSVKPKRNIPVTKIDIEKIRKLVRSITEEEKEKKAKKTIKLNIPGTKNDIEKIRKSIQTITLKEKQKRKRSVSSSGSSSGSYPRINIKSPTSSEDSVFGYDSE